MFVSFAKTKLLEHMGAILL